jgi:hypothetical protein
MPTALQRILALAESESDSSRDRILKRRRDDENLLLLSMSLQPKVPSFRTEKFRRTRLREECLKKLAEKENLIIAEDRKNPVPFEPLSDTLEPAGLSVDQDNMATISTMAGSIKPVLVEPK